MPKKKGLFKRILRETYRIFDQGLDIGNAVIEKTGIEKILIAVSGGGSVGVSTSSGPSGGNNIHYRPPNSTTSIGVGISNGGNASLFVDNHVAMPLTTPQANFIEHPPEKVNHVITDRNQALSEIYGAGYVPESGFETIAVVAVGTAAKQLVQDGIEFASTAIDVWGDAHASIYSASDTHRLEALHRNQDRFEKVWQAISHVAKNPGTIVTHYENKLQQASNAFTAAHKHGDMVGAGNAAGQILADVYTISTIGTGVAKITAKATSRAAKATSNFAKTHDFRAPMTFHYDGSRLNSGIPLDTVKLQNPVVKKTAPVEASNVNAQAAVNKKMRALQNAQQKAVKIEKLSDGRVRYYMLERPSNSPGVTRGSSYVTEYNPATGQLRSWNECYDQCGNVNRIHPKTIDGQDMSAQHYPPTKIELELWARKPKGPK